MSVHSSWQSVLDQLKLEDPKTNDFYMLCKYKGTKKEIRSRFLTLTESIELVQKLIGYNSK